ncbi:MAG: ATPase [Planctomycetota bacterium]|nr:MAG: ATPase [Planctomycetota bacterium]
MVAERPACLLSWSSGKDSAWTLHQLRERGEVEVVGLLTTLNESADRVAMHAVRRELLEAQAAAADLPLVAVDLPWPCSNEQYEARMAAACERAVAQGVSQMAFGDLFLEDIRAYREEKLAGSGLTPIFPLWGRPTEALARRMLADGLRSRITCVNPELAPAEWVGREWDAALLDELPEGVDPCGENGEFHTFVHAGPMFSAPVEIELGEVVERDGFRFADLLPRA